MEDRLSLYKRLSQGLSFDSSPRLRFFSTRDGEVDHEWKIGSELTPLLDDYLSSSAPLRSSLESDDSSSRDSDGKPDRSHDLNSAFNLIVGHSNGKLRSLSISTDQFRQLVDSGHFPASLPTIYSRSGQFAHFIEYDHDGLPNSLFITLQTPFSHITFFSLSLRIKFSSNGTSSLAILLTTEDERLSQPLQYCSQHTSLLKSNPLAFLTHIQTTFSAACCNRLAYLELRVELMESTIALPSVYVQREKRDDKIDYKENTKELHFCHTDLTALDALVSWQNLVLKFCLDMISEVENFTSRPKNETATLKQEINFLQNDCALRHVQNSGLVSRIQTQLSVLHSLISQGDSRTNILLARDSRKIAIAAQRDSKVMRIIGIMTLVFLPASLIASIFSMEIFKWDNTIPDGGYVSRLWWVYVVVTLVITFVVLGIGGFFLRLWGPSEEKLFGKESAGKRVREKDKLV